MNKPEALRLADLLEMGSIWQDQEKAAAELRRLHAECNDLAHQLNESNERNGRLKAQRDALLEVLKYLDKEFRQHGRQHWPEAVRVGAVIKMVKETK